jgi:signal transduction histidine kinase/CheY-like chemotaxis protein
VVTQATYQATRRIAIGVSGALAIAFVLAVLLSRRIASPIASLAAVAKAVGTGASVAPPPPGGIPEVRDLHQALASAASAVRDREDALRTADRAKHEFLAMLSHELRNPLGALASAGAVLQRANPAANVAPAVAIITRQVEHMTRLVDDLLDVSRATSGKISLSRQPVDFAAIVDRTLAALRSAGRLDRHTIRIETTPAWVQGDEARLEQVVSNLVGNAVKYTPPGGTITIRLGLEDRRAVLSVEDTGVGLSPELAPRVFELFVQGERTLDRQAGGLGIGLTLVRRLVELHDGRVDVRSDGPDRGTCFTVTLPTIAPPPPMPETGDDDPAKPHPARRILVIEDHEDARSSLIAGLTQHGYLLAGAADGPDGLRAAAEFRPDVAIVDIGLAGMDGYEVARRMRMSPGGGPALLIALTGYGHADARQLALDAGFDAHLTKPIPPDRLVALIESRLAGSD